MYGFQANAFQNSGFQVDTLSGGSSGAIGYSSTAFDNAYRQLRKVTKDEKIPEPVFEAIKEVAQVTLDKPKKDRGKILRKQIREAGIRVNTLYIAMLENLISEYVRLADEIERDEREQYQNDMAIILLLLS